MHKPSLFCLPANHYTAAAINGVDHGLVNSSRLRNNARKAIVEVIHVFLESRLFRIRPRACKRTCIRIIIRLDRFIAQPDFLHQARRIDLTAINSNATHDGKRFCNYLVRPAGNVICTRRSRTSDACHNRNIKALQIHERAPDFIGRNCAPARRRNPQKQSLRSRTGQSAQVIQHSFFHAGINRAVDIQQCHFRAVIPAFIKNLGIRRSPRSEIRIRSIEIKERLQRIRRHLVNVKQRIGKARLLGAESCNYWLLSQRIQSFRIERNRSLFHSSGNAHTDKFPNILVKRFNIFAGIYRHGISRIRFYRRLVRTMAQEFHLDA